MGEISKAVGQWIVGNVGWSVIILLFIISSVFKVTKYDIDPVGWILGWFGRLLTKDIRKDVADLRAETNQKFTDIKNDRNSKIEELKQDYNRQISELRTDLDGFETSTNESITEMKNGTFANCTMLKARLDEMEKSNDMQTIRQIKAHVLDFANSCLNHRRHTKKDFDNIIKENEEYEALVKKYGLKNDVYAEDYQYVIKIYHKCQDEDSFLKDED